MKIKTIINVGMVLQILLLALLSLILWLVPVYFILLGTSAQWFAYDGVKMAFLLVIGWFHWGSAKVIISAIQSELFNPDSLFSFKASLIVPFAPLMNFRLQRPFFFVRLT